MSAEKKKIRAAFRDAVFARDGRRCKKCSATVADYLRFLDAHHITDRNLMPNGGYVATNGITLCPTCHEAAELFHSTGVAPEGFSPDDLYKLIGSNYDLAVKDSNKLLSCQLKKLSRS